MALASITSERQAVDLPVAAEVDEAQVFDSALWTAGGQSYIVCAFYTPNYLPQVLCLKSSLEAMGINHYIQLYTPRGSWEANTRIKSEFVVDCLKRFPGYNIVYLDADAVVRKPLAFFDDMQGDVAMNFHPTKKSGRWYLRISAGTLGIKNTEGGRRFAAQWAAGQEEASAATVDEDMVYMAFSKLEGVTFTVLPYTYYKIFDAPGDEIVIEHFQASRTQPKILKRRRRLRQIALATAGVAGGIFLLVQIGMLLRG